MTAPARANPAKLFATANPHALATILEASETKRIIASRDIFDLNGIKLWARDQPVSGALQRKLLDRQLRNPLETCLAAEDGVTTLQLLKAVQALVESDTPLAAWVRPHAAQLAKEAAQIPLHSVVQLLLTAAQASRPEAWQHALDAMVLAGALMASGGGSGPEVRIAMLGGLAHDLGEVYIDPRHGEADADRTLDFTSYQQLVVHPHVSQLLLSQLTNYPASLARAVGEHHERGDGSGYPHALRRDAISPLGRLLAVTEAALGVLRGQAPQLARVSVALRVVPGEFDLAWVGRINDAMATQPPLSGKLDLAHVQSRLTRLDAALQVAQQTTMALQPVAQTQPLKEALNLVQHLLGRLRAGWYASGLWSADAVAQADAAEVEAVEDELFFRLQAINRAARLCAGDLQGADAERMNQLGDALVAIGP
jgi:hypothetical protein